MCLCVLNHVFILFASLGCRVWHNKRSRQTESWSYLQYFGILWCWLSDWSVTDVCSQIRNHGWDVFNHQLFVSMLFLSLQFFFSFDFYHSINISFLLLKKKTCFVFLRSVDRLVNLCVPAMLIPDFLSNQNELEKCHSWGLCLRINI